MYFRFVQGSRDIEPVAPSEIDARRSERFGSGDNVGWKLRKAFAYLTNEYRRRLVVMPSTAPSSRDRIIQVEYNISIIFRIQEPANKSVKKLRNPMC